jgi:hypothetical protein
MASEPKRGSLRQGALDTVLLMALERPEPFIVTRDLARSLPSRVVSLRPFGGSTVADDLVAPNKVIHPAVMSAAGFALSA